MCGIKIAVLKKLFCPLPFLEAYNIIFSDQISFNFFFVIEKDIYNGLRRKSNSPFQVINASKTNQWGIFSDTAPLLTLTGQNVSICLHVKSNIAKRQQTNSANGDDGTVNPLLGKVILRIGHYQLLFHRQ